MKTRRHHSIAMLIVASVFFCLLACSCGIPTYFVPTFNVTSGTGTFTINYVTDSNITTTSEDYGGLVFLYHISDAIVDEEKSTIIKNFTSTYVPSSYNGLAIKVTDADDPVLTYTNSSSEEVNVYAFTVDGSIIVAPTYSLDLDIGSNYTATATLTYDETNNVIEYSDTKSSNITLGLNTDFEQTSTEQYIYIYAAMSASSTESFTNVYWSALRYCGYIVIPALSTT